MGESAVESDFQRRIDAFAADWSAVTGEIGKVVVGLRDVVDQTLVSLLGGGHALLEGVPGIGKTLLVRTLADALDLSFSRIQFTPDLMPADITGTNVIRPDAEGLRQFEFQPGPILANLILADEINRATPKTQSAVLEAMAERTVTVARTTHRLSEPFFVLATQNPLEMEGTYPLPEAQVDRFLLKIRVGAPTQDELVEILERTTGAETPAAEKVLGGDRVLELRQLVREVPAAGHVKQYVARLVRATHPEASEAPEAVGRWVRYGASPRAAQALLLGARVRALTAGRAAVSFEDVRSVAHAALRHRLILNFEAQAEGIDPDEIVDSLLSELSRKA